MVISSFVFAASPPKFTAQIDIAKLLAEECFHPQINPPWQAFSLDQEIPCMV
jgi:hypothetical protein